MTADGVLELLRARHDRDVFVPECKNGPTQGVARGHMVRMDAWVMRASWTKPATIAYEVKVDRSDFLNDQKWPNYLPCCNELWFVCPSGLIAVEEVPEQAGLLWVAKTGTKLLTKKKAPFRDVELSEDLWRYLLMCRTRITRDQHPEHGSDDDARTARAEVHARYVQNQKRRREVGYLVARHTRSTVDRLERRVQQLNDALAAARHLRKTCRRLGIDEEDPWEARRTIDQLLGKGLEGALRRGVADLARTLERVEKVLEEPKGERS